MGLFIMKEMFLTRHMEGGAVLRQVAQLLSSFSLWLQCRLSLHFSFTLTISGQGSFSLLLKTVEITVLESDRIGSQLSHQCLSVIPPSCVERQSYITARLTHLVCSFLARVCGTCLRIPALHSGGAGWRRGCLRGCMGSGFNK